MFVPFGDLEYDDRLSNLNLRGAVLPFIMRNWSQTFAGFLFSILRLYFNAIISGPDKRFIIWHEGS